MLCLFPAVAGPCVSVQTEPLRKLLWLLQRLYWFRSYHFMHMWTKRQHTIYNETQRVLTSVNRVSSIGSVLSSRLTAGYLHTCAVKEQGAGRRSKVRGQMYRTEITFHCCPVFTFTDLTTKRFYPLICPELRRQEAATWREVVEFMLSSVRLIIWYHLGLFAHLLRLKLSEISQRDSGDFYSLYRRWKPVSVSSTGSWRRWGSCWIHS